MQWAESRCGGRGAKRKVPASDFQTKSGNSSVTLGGEGDLEAAMPTLYLRLSPNGGIECVHDFTANVSAQRRGPKVRVVSGRFVRLSLLNDSANLPKARGRNRQNGRF